MEIVGLIRGISRAIDGVVAPLYEGGLIKLSELGILLPLRYNSKPMIARRLADRMSLSPAAISKTLASLEKRGLIIRQPSPTNRRVALVCITDLGKEALDSVFPRQLEILSGLFSGVGEARMGIVEALYHLLDAVEHRTKRKAAGVGSFTSAGQEKTPIRGWGV